MRPGSTGLGLYISSQFARHMRAQLGAIRHRDGTSFFIELLSLNKRAFSDARAPLLLTAALTQPARTV